MGDLSSFTCRLRAAWGAACVCMAWVSPLEDDSCHDEELQAPVLRGVQHVLRNALLRNVLRHALLASAFKGNTKSASMFHIYVTHQLACRCAFNKVLRVACWLGDVCVYCLCVWPIPARHRPCPEARDSSTYRQTGERGEAPLEEAAVVRGRGRVL